MLEKSQKSSFFVHPVINDERGPYEKIFISKACDKILKKSIISTQTVLLYLFKMLVGEHYSFDRNEKVLGRGGFGVVYKGYDKRVSILKFIFFF